MFDSPSNLPFEPPKTPPLAPPIPPAAPPTARPVAPPPSVPSGKKEPEDIFSGLDRSPEPMNAPMPMREAPRRSPLKLIVVIVVLVLVLGGAGFAAWYFLFSSPATPSQGTVTQAPTTQVPVVVPSTAEPVVEKPPILPTPDQAVPTNTEPVTNAPAGTNVPPPQPITPPQPALGAVAVIPEGVDSDADQLSDTEEVIVGTNPHIADTDGDGYKDGSEVLSGYDPLSKGGKLSASSRWKVQVVIGTWKALLPTTWIIRPDTVVAGDMVIDTATPATFVASVSDKPETMTMGQWFAQHVPGLDPATLATLKTKAGDDAWQTPDRLRTFIVHGTSVLTLRYSLNTASAYDLRTLYAYVASFITTNGK